MGEVMRILEVDESLKDEEILDIRGIGISLMIFYKFQTPRIFFCECPENLYANIRQESLMLPKALKAHIIL